MAITASLDSQKRFFRTTMTGTVTIDEMMKHLATVRSAGAQLYPGIIDARQVETLSFGRRDLTGLVHDMKDFFDAARPAPRALVVNNVVHIGFARLVASLLAGWMSIAVFEDIASAEAWLNGFNLCKTDSDDASLKRGDQRPENG
jgi:hypothetical protein